jgi:hypothetical protein
VVDLAQQLENVQVTPANTAMSIPAAIAVHPDPDNSPQIKRNVS